MPASSSIPFRVAVDVRRVPSMRRLATDYVYDFDALAPFFAGNPATDESWRSAIARAQAAARPRAAIADAILDQQRRWSAPDATLRSAAELGDPQAVAVVTGQQAGLFGGPLYTLLKAITAIKLAAQVRSRYRVPAVPVFWVEDEDHDWDEVASCIVLDGEFERRAITLPALPGAGTEPVATVALGDAALPAIDALAATLARTEFSQALVDGLRNTYAGVTMSEAFGRWMLRMLGPHGLIVFDAANPAMKPYARRLFAEEIEKRGRAGQLAREAGLALTARGYHAQVTPAEGAVALFHLDARRTPIQRGEGGLRVGEGERTVADVLKEVEERPAAFSPNVLMRPLVQDSLFPTVAYVAGPNELAYLGQLRGVYDEFGVPMPLMFPRVSATLLDSSSARFLSRTDLSFETLARGDEAALNRLLEEQLPPQVERAWQEAREAVGARMEALVAALPQLDPTLQGAARSALGRMTHDLDALHGKIVQAAKRRDETLRRQFGHAKALAFPGGEPQERVLGFVYFLNRYGPALVDQLLTDLPLEMGQHWVLAL